METYDKEKLYNRDVHIYLEANPNPNSLKFVVNFMLVDEGESHDFPDAASAEKAPLARALFDFEEVERVFYMNNFVTVTKKEDVEWVAIQDKIKQFIKEYLEAEKPLLLEGAVKSNAEVSEEDSEQVKQIKNVLEEYVKPAVEQDGGAITFQDYQDGIVKVQLQGSCSGCPSSMVTLKAGIENLFQKLIPEVKGVEAEEV